MSAHYDVVIVGAGVAGSALAHALATITSPSRSSTYSSPRLNILLLERSLPPPDRIVGELLQPAGAHALRTLGLSDCVEGIDAVPVRGYCVWHDGSLVHIPYPPGHEGRSFHHGRFIARLRESATAAPGVRVMQATVTELVHCDESGRVVGVRATRKKDDSSLKDTLGESWVVPAQEKEEKETLTFTGDLVFIADGCFSNFRKSVLIPGAKPPLKPVTKSHFVGVVLKDAKLPIDEHGTVALIKGHGPVLLYQISEHSTRILIDVRQPLPQNLKSHVLTHIVHQLPPSVQEPVRVALASSDRLRSMPNSFLPAAAQGGTRTHPGVVVLGDAWNMRHPLTGGGMSVALHDVCVLSDLLRDVRDLGDWQEVQHVLGKWWWRRKGLAATINVLSVALYDLFGAEDENLEVLRVGCFKYFEMGGECVNGPVSLLSGVAPSPLLLTWHFFAVALYSIWILFAHPRVQCVPNAGEKGDKKEKVLVGPPPISEYPALCVLSVKVFWTACVVFGPLIWSEIRWW